MAMAKRTGSTIPPYRRSKKRNPIAVFLGWIVKLALAFIIFTVLWVLAYRFINPPTTATMLGDMLSGRGATRDWMEIERIDRDMVRAAIAAEDGKFCQHHGFDIDAIQEAARRNASGGRIRGGSTISQQTAKNAFLWQGGGYFRKGLEAWFTFLMEQMYPKRRIMELYLNLAETGIGTYGVNAGAQRYFGHDSSAMTRTEAARIAAVLPLPKKRGAIAPKGFTRRYGGTISARIGVVGRDGLDACVYEGISAPPAKEPPRSTGPARPAPGEEYESAGPLPPVEEPASDAPSIQDSPVPPATEPSPQPAPGFPPSNEASPETSGEPEQEPPPPPGAG